MNKNTYTHTFIEKIWGRTLLNHTVAGKNEWVFSFINACPGGCFVTASD